MKNTVAACLLPIAILTVIATLSASPGHALERKDILVIGMQTANAISLDPAKAYEVASSLIVNQLYDKLVDFDVNDLTQPVPELAESWEIDEDGRTWRFHLRQGVLFASGNPVNADAVVFSLRRVIKLQASPSWILTQFGLTEESITPLDDSTVQIVLDRQYAPGIFLSCLAYTVGSILDRELVMAHENAGDLGQHWLNEHSAGSGAYSLKSWKRNESFALQANAHYWKGTPTLLKVSVNDVPEATTRMMMLEKGDIDIAWGLFPDQLRKLETHPDVRIYTTPTFSVRYLGMNVGHEALAHSQVRDAVRYAIDYDEIVDRVLQGAGIKGQTFIPQGMFGHNPAMPYQRNLDNARQLLADAGFPDGFNVELVCTPSSPLPDIAVKIQDDLSKIGIRVTIMQMTGAQLFKQYRTQNLQMVLASWGSDYLDPDANAKPFAHSDSLGDDATIKQLAWRNKYVNLQTSALVEEGLRELNPEKRADIYKKITDIILDDGPYAILYYPLNQYAVRANVKNFTASPSFFLYDFSIMDKE